MLLESNSVDLSRLFSTQPVRGGPIQYFCLLFFDAPSKFRAVKPSSKIISKSGYDSPPPPPWPRCNRTRQRPGSDNNHTIWSLSGPEILGPHNDVGKIVRSLSGPETPVSLRWSPSHSIIIVRRVFLDRPHLVIFPIDTQNIKQLLFHHRTEGSADQRGAVSHWARGALYPRTVASFSNANSLSQLPFYW